MVMHIVAALSVLVLWTANAVAAVGAAGTAEVLTTQEDQQDLRLTIYTTDLALVYDQRRLVLDKGESTVAFREVSSKMRPETALLAADGLQVFEQNFEYDLLSPQSLLRKYVGRTVLLATMNPVSGDERLEEAQVLSALNGPILQTAQHIRAKGNSQIFFPDVPADLRDRPTLTMQIAAAKQGERLAALTYLTTGLSWRADYVAELQAGEKRLQLNGWVTLNNNSGATYTDAQLQLVAGDVHTVPVQQQGLQRAMVQAMAESAMLADDMGEESMFEYHLYSLGRRTTIKENQQKQVALMKADDVAYRQQYIVRGAPHYYHSGVRDKADRQPVVVYVEMINDHSSGLGNPLPGGVIRVYTRDSRNALQFVGEDTIEHTPVNEKVRLKLGKAFDITAEKTQVDFQKIAGNAAREYVFESEYVLTLKNAKSETVTVSVEEPVPGDWELISSSMPAKKAAAGLLEWEVPVVAGGEQQLQYRVRVRM